jgi:hypothetical protein
MQGPGFKPGIPNLFILGGEFLVTRLLDRKQKKIYICIQQSAYLVLNNLPRSWFSMFSEILWDITWCSNLPLIVFLLIIAPIVVNVIVVELLFSYFLIFLLYIHSILPFNIYSRLFPCIFVADVRNILFFFDYMCSFYLPFKY